MWRKDYFTRGNSAISFLAAEYTQCVVAIKRGQRHIAVSREQTKYMGLPELEYYNSCLHSHNIIIHNLNTEFTFYKMVLNAFTDAYNRGTTKDSKEYPERLARCAKVVGFMLKSWTGKRLHIGAQLVYE